jgi:hypothetical protein
VYTCVCVCLCVCVCVCVSAYPILNSVFLLVLCVQSSLSLPSWLSPSNPVLVHLSSTTYIYIYIFLLYPYIHSVSVSFYLHVLSVFQGSFHLFVCTTVYSPITFWRESHSLLLAIENHTQIILERQSQSAHCHRESYTNYFRETDTVCSLP